MAILINGNGNKAIWAAQDADLIASLVGNVTGIAAVGNQFAATQEDASTIGLADGVIITKEGRRIQLDTGEVDLFTIPTGTAGVTSYYIIGYKLSQQSDTSQICETFVQKMNSSSETITEDTFKGGATEVYVSCYRVTQDGLNIDTITALLPSLRALKDKTNKYSGSSGGATYVTVDSIGYDSTNKKLGLKVNGADTVIPFSGGYDWKYLGTGTGSQTFSYTVTLSTPYIILFKYKLNDGSIIYWFGTSMSSFSRMTENPTRDMVVTSITGSISRSGETWTVSNSYGKTYAIALPMGL